MKSFLRFITRPNSLAIILVVLFALIASRDLFQIGYWNHHDDLQAMRVLEMEKCFMDGQFPCRWVPDMGYGFGYPLFNFYPPLPYYLGQVIRLFGFTFLGTVKALGVLAFVASGVTMYFLGKELFGKKGGILASIFYVWAPYHSVDVFVRGAYNEAFAMIWFPLTFLFSLKLIKEDKKLYKWIIGLALAWFGVFTSHNLMVLIFTPFFGIWTLLFLLKYKKLRRLPHLVISGALAFGLASFFTLPVFFEKGLVQVDTLISGFFDYTAHFTTINQLFFSRFWGDGPSLWGPQDEMPFPIGHFHWVIALIIALYFGYRLLKSRKLSFITESDAITASIFFLLMGAFTAFMTHNKSTFIWKALESQLAFVQFPWRFLALNIFAFSALAGLVTYLLDRFRKDKTKLLNFALYQYEKLILIALIIGVVAWNWEFFGTDTFGPVTDESKFSGVAWELQQTAGIYDYLPKTANTAPKSPREVLAEFMEGEGEIVNEKDATKWSSFDLKVDEVPATIRVNTIYFPGWELYVNEEERETFIPETEEWGRYYFTIDEPGYYNVRSEFHNTPIRTAGDYISLVSWTGLGLFIWRKRKSK